MLAISHLIYDYLYPTNSLYKKQFTESPEYNYNQDHDIELGFLNEYCPEHIIDILPEPKNTKLYNCNTNNYSNSSNKFIGSGYSNKYSLFWIRKNIKSDYDVIYKGSYHVIKIKDINIIINKVNIFDIAHLLSNFIDNKFDIYYTIYDLLL